MKPGAPHLLQVAKCAAKGWVDDAAPSMGAALAFYTLFSLAPLLVVITALAGIFMGRDAAHEALMGEVARVIGDGAAKGVRDLLEATTSGGEGGFAIVAGLVALLLGATTVFAELRSDLNRIWRYRPPKSSGVIKFLKARLLAFGIVLAAGALLLASVAASAVLAALGERWFPDAEALLHAGELAISFLVMTGLFAMIYKLLPGPRIEWRDVWVGAAVTALLFSAGKVAIAFYLARSAVGESFGAAGAIVGVIAWVFYSAQVFFLGAEFTRHYALRHGSQQDVPLDRRRRPFVIASDAALVERAERLVRGEDPVLERRRRSA